MTGPAVETAVWRQVHWITIHVEPDDGGTVAPISPDGGWWVHGDNLSLTAVANGDSGYGFTGWTGDTASSANPLYMVITEPVALTAQFEKGDVSVKTDPPGLAFVADGDTFTAPRTFFWKPGEQHTLRLPDNQNTDSGIRYVFDRWQDTAGNTRTVIIPEDPVTYTALFNPEYYLDVASDYAEESIAGGLKWYAPGDTAHVRIDSLTAGAGGIRHRFSGWTGSVQGEHCDIQIVMNGPVCQEALWEMQYELKASATPAYGGSVRVVPAASWFDSGAGTELHAEPRDTNFTFDGWSGDASGTANPVSLVMDEPKTVFARFTTSFVYPPVVAGIPDLTINEDQVLNLPYDILSMYVSDLNDPLDSLDFNLLDTPEFQIQQDRAARMVKLIPEPNWFGTAEVILNATDPWLLSDCDTFVVTVQKAADPPEPFALIAPEDSASVPASDPRVDFIWHRSINVDPGDAIRYEFLLGPDSTFLSVGSVCIEIGPDTTISINTNSITSRMYWAVNAKDLDGYVVRSRARIIEPCCTLTESAPGLPRAFTLKSNYPNPFNGGTRIPFDVPARGHVLMTVYDIRGREVGLLLDETLGPGTHIVSWQARDDFGNTLPSGAYIVRIRYQDAVYQLKMLYIQ